MTEGPTPSTPATPPPGAGPVPTGRFRTLRGLPRVLESLMLTTLTVSGALWALDVAGLLGFSLFREQYLGLFWGLILSTAFLLVPAHAGAPRDRVPWYDWVAFALSLLVGFNVMVFYPTLLYESALATPDKVLMGALSLLLLIEATRRTVGRMLLTILLLFLVYCATAEYIPGIFNGSGVTLQRMAIYLYLDTNALLGIPLVVASTIVLTFVLLGQALFATGGGAFFTDLAMAAMGRYRGGPAKIAVMASTLFGTISGTAVSNVVTTGIITIPMMEKNGYRKEVAAAVEAVASTGGQIMPPVMGASAFLLAEFLEIPYSHVVIAALVPALLYYWLLFIQVDLLAARNGLKGFPEAELPRFIEVVKRGWMFVIPLALLIYSLFWLNFRPGKAALLAIAGIAVIAVFQRSGPPALLRVLGILEATGRGVMEIGIITGIAGIIIGVLNLSGLGFSISLALVQIGGNSMVLLLIFAALLSILLGMGMPTVPVYILLAVLIAPSLEKLGLAPLAVHLFILYFGLLSMITPPVAIASYAAAAVAGSEPVRTAWISVKLGAMAYVVPFIFIFSQELLMMGPLGDILWSIASTALGAFWLGVALTGYLFRVMAFPPRLLLGACAVALFFSHSYADYMGYWINIAGALAGTALLILDRHLARRKALAQE